jgi:hypothetical protein
MAEQHQEMITGRIQTKKMRKDLEESTSGLRHSVANDDKNVPEQSMQVTNEGYEEAFENIDRKDVEPASEIVKNLQKKLTDVVKERDSLSNENKIIKAQPGNDVIITNIAVSSYSIYHSSLLPNPFRYQMAPEYIAWFLYSIIMYKNLEFIVVAIVI